VKYVHKANLRWCVPNWTGRAFMAIADALEENFAGLKSQAPELWPESPNQPLRFWIEMVMKTGDVRVWEESEETHYGLLRIFCSNDTVIELPLNPFFRGHDDIAQMHTVYCHGLFGEELPSYYVGITRRRWYDRLAEHISSAQRGSPYLFHRAIRERRFVRHRIFVNAVDYEFAMETEEQFVESTLYPMGLNMIPGGFAGLRYLSKLGIRARTTEERDAAVQSLLLRPNLEGKPNPLCAARWESDPDYAERVICGHSGRLTADQVRMIRTLAGWGHDQGHITKSSGGKPHQIQSVMSGKRYGRIR
jgi:hypothetical protein